MSTGGMPDVNRLLEDEDEEDEAAPQGGSAEAEGRDDDESGEEDGQGSIDGEGEGFEEEISSQRTELSSRRNSRIRNLNRRLQESNRRNEELERRMNALEQRPSPQQEQQTRESEEARMAMMSPEERMNYTLDRGMHRFNYMVQQAQATQIENNDRSHFQNIASNDRLARRFAPQVEELFTTLKNAGRMTAREVIYKYLVGEAAVKAANGGQNRSKRRQAEREINRNRPSSGSGRSDVSNERRRGAQTLEQRLEGKLI